MESRVPPSKHYKNSSVFRAGMRCVATVQLLGDTIPVHPLFYAALGMCGPKALLTIWGR